MIPILGILYDETDPATYSGVTLRLGDDREVFNSGNPTVDYLTAYFVLSHRYRAAGFDVGDVPVMASSSVNHFVFDGGTLNDSDPSQEEVDAAVAAAKAYLEAA